MSDDNVIKMIQSDEACYVQQSVEEIWWLAYNDYTLWWNHELLNAEYSEALMNVIWDRYIQMYLNI